MNKRKYLPLILIEAYLLFTLILLKIGPLYFSLRNEALFVMFIILYHCAFITGYFFGIKMTTPSRINIYYGDDRLIKKRYFWLIIIVFYIWIVVTRNNTHASSYIPVDLFRYAINGLINPASRYYINKGTDVANLFHGNRLVTGSVLPIYSFYYCFPALMMLYWKNITKIQRMFSVGIILLCLLQGFAAGTNAIIFHVIFAMGGAVLIIISTKKEQFVSLTNEIKKKRRIKRLMFIILVLGTQFFVYNIDTRLSGNVLSYYVSKSADISINPLYNSLITSGKWVPVIKGLSSIQSYLCQGYYGFSLALDQPFTTTYGIGHSYFLASSFDSMLGTNIISRMYQEKITNVWSRTVNWHSFYSQMANDVGFVGVVIVMFILGMMLSKAWVDIIEYGNPIAKMFFITLLPVFIFIPMNNQMGNLYGTFVSFWVLLIMWKVTRKYCVKVGSIHI